MRKLKTYKVTNIKWANFGDLNLPFYSLYKYKIRIPSNYWSGIWEYPFISLHIPEDAKCLSLNIDHEHPNLLNSFPNATSFSLKNLKCSMIPYEDDSVEYAFFNETFNDIFEPVNIINELLRITKNRVVIILKISDYNSLCWDMLIHLSRIYGFNIPPIPSDRLVSSDKKVKKYGVTPNKNDDHIRILGLIFENIDKSTMNCGIIIPHWESYEFLKFCIKKINDNKNEKISQHIYIIDDESKDGSYQKITDYWGKSPDVTVLQAHRHNKNDADVGLLLDEAIKHVNERYVCMIDADVFPISKHWLTFPIFLLEKYNCSSVGCDTGLSNSYFKICSGKWQNKNGYKSNSFTLYDNDNFTCTNNFYRVMKTPLAKIVSEQIGFTRRSNRPLSSSRYLKLFSEFKNFSKLFLIKNGLVRSVYCPGGCDNGVAANHFIDINRLGPKFNIPLNSWVDFTPKDGVFGQNICGLIFHFALSTRALSNTRREVDQAGVSFSKYSKQILENGFNDRLLNELLDKCIIRPGGYDGTIPALSYVQAKWFFDEEFKLYSHE